MGYLIPCDVLLTIQLGELAGKGIAAQGQAGHWVVRKLQCVSLA